MEQLKIKIKEKVTNKQDKILLFNVLDKTIESKQKNIVISTNLYNMYELQLIKENILKYINNIYITGGNKDFERCILIIYPGHVNDIEKYISENISIHLSLLEISFNSFKNEDISHRDVLGSILSLGINRSLIGDIYVNDSNCYVYVKPEIQKYIVDNLKQIKHIKVKVKQQMINEEIAINEEGKIVEILVNSLRLDNILAHSLKLSRTKVNQLINSERVFVNWKVEKKIDKKIEISDVISIRGKGRIKVNNILGSSKKGKLILEIEIKG